MITLRKSLLLVCGVLLVGPSASAQAESPIGSFLAPWSDSGNYFGSPMAVTPDGSLIAFVEGLGTCFNHLQRISMIRPDGTGYRVVVDTPVLNELKSGVYTLIDELRLAGDGRTLAFKWPQQVVNCDNAGGPRWFLVDVESGSVTELKVNGNGVGYVSFTDDGQTIAFKGFDPALGAWGFYTADEDGRTPELILDLTPFSAGPSVISGDGKKLLFLDFSPVSPFAGDIYVLDIASGAPTKLNPQVLNFIYYASLSADGSRIVFSLFDGTMYAVEGSGANFRQIQSPAAGFEVTMTRDGNWIFLTSLISGTAGVFTNRMSWDETILELVADPYFNSQFLSQQPINADGSFHAHWTPGPNKSLAVTFLSTPVLTTYGYGNPGTTLTWDVGGEAGDSYILAMSLDALSPGAGTQYGLLELEPASLLILDSGSVLGPNNIGSLQITIPGSLDLPVPVPVHFQALVQPQGGGGALTNRTTVLLQNAPSVALTTASRSGGPGGIAGTNAWTAQPAWPPVTLTPEERMRQLIQSDPKLAVEWQTDH